MVELIDRRSHDLMRFLQDHMGSSFTELQTIITNPVTLTKRLKYLCQINLIMMDTDGYSLTHKGDIVLDAFDMIKENIIGCKHQLSDENFEKINHDKIGTLLKIYTQFLLEHFCERLLTVILFGSFSRGTWRRNSDIDLLLIVDNWDKPSWERSRELRTIHKQLRKTGIISKYLKEDHYYPISHYMLSNTDLDREHPILWDVLLDGIILYERKDFAQKLFQKVQDRLEFLNAKCITTPAKKRYWICNFQVED